MFKKKKFDKGKTLNNFVKRNELENESKIKTESREKVKILNVQDMVTWEVNVLISKQIREKLLMSS